MCRLPGTAMKILMINKFLYPNGGSETYMFRLGAALQEAGHEVQYFGMEHEGRVVGNRAESYTSPVDFHTGGIGRILYPFRIIYSGEAKRKLRPVLEEMQPDVIHLNNINFQLTPSVIDEARDFEEKHPEIYGSGRKLRIVYTAHDAQWVCPNHMLRIPEGGGKDGAGASPASRLCMECLSGEYGACERNRCIHGSRLRSFLGRKEAEFYRRRETYGKVDRIICPSAFYAGILSYSPVLAPKVVTLHNFYEPGDGEPEGTEGTGSHGGDYVLYFGRYAEEKGVRTLLSAARSLPDIPFVFAGSGPLEKELGGVPNVTVRGFLRGKELKETIRGARFAVYPSEWYENCPMSILEALGAGTPVLASDLGGSAELISTDGKNGTGALFRGGDAEDLAEKIRELWDDRKRTEGMSSRCRGFVQGHFDTPEQYAEKILGIYRGETDK